MKKQEYRKAAYDMIYLVSCAIDHIPPSQKRIKNLRLHDLFEVCEQHNLTAITAYALEEAGRKDASFSMAKAREIRREILFTTEREQILSRMEQEHLWYLPLKGIILKEYYPKLGMRQMCDNDILISPSHRKAVNQIMLERGYDFEHYSGGHDDCYKKPPIYNFEMHFSLFDQIDSPELFQYYSNIKKQLIKENEKNYALRFRDEDFYLYMICHEYKHFRHSGTGVRSLLDTYIYLKQKEESLNWDELDQKTKQLSLYEYEHMNRNLAKKLFSRQKLSKEEKKLLDYYIFSGTYGNIVNQLENKLKSYEEKKGSVKGTLQYIRDRLLKPMDQVKLSYPFFYRHKFLLPVLCVYRWGKGLTIKRNIVLAEAKTLIRMKQKKHVTKKP